jgi:large subunit ribosomal protein L14
MKSVKASVSKPLPLGAYVDVVDNSGARIIQIISVKGYKTRTRKLASAGVADMVTAAVTAGKPDMRHKVVQAVIVRQKKEYTRPEGIKVKFEDNAAIILKDVKLGMPKGTIVKGPIAKEVALRWSQVAKIANTVL